MDIFDGDIAVMRTSHTTPLGEIRFLTSMRMDVDFSTFTAIAHHVETGVMTMAVTTKELGENARTATADAAQKLFFTLQAIQSYRTHMDAH